MDIYRRLERGDLTTDHVRPYGQGPQATPHGDEVRHACPECPLARPRPDCSVCAGHGTLSEVQIARYEQIRDRAVLLG